MRETVDTTYADLRPTDLVIDKSGQAWPIDGLLPLSPDPVKPVAFTFWLLDPVTKVKAHLMQKPAGDPVKVSRLPTQADEASKLEAEFPLVTPSDDYYVDAENPVATMAEAVAAVEEIGGTVEAEVSAAEVDAAAATTDDAPLTLPAFSTMTPLEARSHLYLLHGVMAHDVQSRDTLSTWHNELHSAENTVKSKTVPHVHAASTDAKSHG
jgi:hypothetical protein